MRIWASPFTRSMHMSAGYEVLGPTYCSNLAVLLSQSDDWFFCGLPRGVPVVCNCSLSVAGARGGVNVVCPFGVSLLILRLLLCLVKNLASFFTIGQSLPSSLSSQSGKCMTVFNQI